MSARDELANYAITTRTVTADGLEPYLNDFAAEVRSEVADDVHRAELPKFPAGETPELVAKTVRAVDWRIAQDGSDAPYAVAADVVADFFRPGHTYAREHHAATIRFLVKYLDESPCGTYRVAFGWRIEDGDVTWSPFDSDDFTGWTDITEGAKA